MNRLLNSSNHSFVQYNFIAGGKMPNNAFDGETGEVVTLDPEFVFSYSIGYVCTEYVTGEGFKSRNGMKTLFFTNQKKAEKFYKRISTIINNRETEGRALAKKDKLVKVELVNKVEKSDKDKVALHFSDEETLFIEMYKRRYSRNKFNKWNRILEENIRKK